MNLKIALLGGDGIGPEVLAQSVKCLQAVEETFNHHFTYIEQGLLQLRRELQLFTNIRPVKIFPTLVNKSPLKKHVIFGTDFVIYRELTGGIYFGEKKLSEDGTVASDLCEYSEKEISRIGQCLGDL